MHTKKSVAVFLIVLILSLPVYSAQVLAAGNLRNEKISGSEGVPGFIQYGDELTVEVEAKKDTGVVEASDIIIGASPFGSCAAPDSDGWRKCTRTVGSYQPTPPYETYFTIYLYEGTEELERIESVKIIVDDLLPEIKTFDINTNVIGPATPLSYSYRIEDNAFTQGDITKCSGVKEFMLYMQGNEEPALTTISENPTLCVLDSSAQLTAEQLTSLGFGDGLGQLCIKARDRMNHPNLWTEETCRTINIDTAQPGFGGITIEGAEDNQITLSTGTTNLLVTARFTSENGFSRTNVHGNLAALNPSLTDILPNSCDIVSGLPSTYDCTFNIQTALSAPETSAQLSVAATDDIGNAQEGSAPFTIRIDNTAPTISSLTVKTKNKDDQYVTGWLSSNRNDLTLVIEDSGFAGVNKDNVKASFTGLRKFTEEGELSVDVPADRQNDAGTEFYWDDIDCSRCSSGFGLERVTVSVTDDAGNTAEPHVVNFDVDKNSPLPRQVSFKSDLGATALVVNDNLVIEVDVEESLSEPVTAFANLINFTRGNSPHQGTCVEKPDEPHVYRCTWTGIGIADSKSYQNVGFTFSDALGNEAEITARIRDTSVPEITGITIINEQTQESGWVSNIANENTLVVTISDPGAGISIETVTATLGGLSGSAQPDECTTPTSSTTHTCYWNSRSCSSCSGQINVAVTATGVSSEQSFTNSDTFQVDNFPPTLIDEPQIVVEGQADKEFFEDGDNLIVTMNFSDAHSSDSGLWKAVGDFNELVEEETNEIEITTLVPLTEDIGARTNVCKEYQTDTGSCRNGKCYSCVWKVSDIHGPAENAKLTLTFFDKVNREVSVDKEGIMILVGAGSSEDIWNHDLLKTIPEKLDLQVLGFKEKSVFYQIQLQEKEHGLSCNEEFKILEVELKPCDGDSAQNVRLGGIYATDDDLSLSGNNYKQTNPFHIKLTIERSLDPAPIAVLSEERDEESLDSTVDKKLPLSCTITIKTQCNNNIYTEDELIEDMDIYFYNNPLDSPNARLEKEIEDLENSRIIKQGRLISSMKRFLDKAEYFCRLLKLFSNIAAGISVIDATVGTTLDAFPPTKPVAVTIRFLDAKMSGVLVEGWFKALNKYCSYLSCEVSTWPVFGDWIDDQMGVFSSQNVAETFGMARRSEGRGEVEAGENTATGNQVPSSTEVVFDRSFMKPKNSILISVLTGCLPGIVYNLEKLRQIDCQYLTCLKTNVRNGWPKFTCSSTRASLKCRYWYGQVFWTIPWTAFADYALNIVKDYFSNPLSLVFTGASYACQHFAVTSNWQTAGCTIGSINKVLGQVNGALDDYRRIKEDYKFVEPADLCKEIDDQNRRGPSA